MCIRDRFDPLPCWAGEDVWYYKIGIRSGIPEEIVKGIWAFAGVAEYSICFKSILCCVLGLHLIRYFFACISYDFAWKYRLFCAIINSVFVCKKYLFYRYKWHFRSGFETVSYTHLDVYKRQVSDGRPGSLRIFIRRGSRWSFRGNRFLDIS